MSQAYHLIFVTCCLIYWKYISTCNLYNANESQTEFSLYHWGIPHHLNQCKQSITNYVCAIILFQSNKNNIFTKLKCNLEDGHPLKIFMSTETSDQYLEILRIIHAIYPTNDVIWFTNNDHAEKDIIISRKVLLHECLSPLCMVQLRRFVRDLLNWNTLSITSLILLNQQRICIVCNSIKERIFLIDILIDLQRQFLRL